jgi:hypothetical protein
MFRSQKHPNYLLLGSLLVQCHSNTISHRYACTVWVCSMHVRYVCAVCMRGNTMPAEEEDVDQIGKKPYEDLGDEVTASTF